MRNRRIWLDAVMTNRLPHTALNDTPKDYTATGVDPWKIEGGRMFGRGGSTIHWGGWCPRQMPEDFTLRTNTGRELDWPYSYKELEPYYGQAEHWIGVAGDSQSGSRAWRSGPYPFEAPVFTEPDGVVIKAFKQLDITYENAPLSRFAKPSNGRPACQTFGTCKYCPIGARFTGDQGLARVEDNVEIRLNAAVTEIVMANKSKAAGVKYV